MKYFLSVLLLICFLLPTTLSVAALDETLAVNVMKTSSVLDDLNGATIGDHAFSMADYPYNEAAFDPDGEPHMELLSFFENGYSDFSSEDERYEDYSLFIYLYNPTNVEISSNPYIKTATLSFDNGASFNKYSLQFISAGGDGTHNELYLKFMVRVNSAQLRSKLSNKERRTYHVSEISIGGVSSFQTGSDWVESLSFTYTGVLPGYAMDDDAPPLECQVTGFEVLQLDLHSTYYRPSGKKVANTSYYDQLNTVYFSIPNDVLEKYGGLYKVHFDSFVYNTKAIYMIGDADAYKALSAHVGLLKGEDVDKTVGYKVYGYITEALYSKETVENGNVTSESDAFLPINLFTHVKSHMQYYEVYNDDKVWSPINGLGADINTRNYTLYWLLDASKPNLTAEALSEYALNYLNRYTTDEEYELINGKYPSFLFEDENPAGFVKGYNEFYVSADDTLSMSSSHQLVHSWWGNLWDSVLDFQLDYGCDSIDDIKMIESVTVANLNAYSKEDFCNRYFIDSDDYDGFSAYVREQEKNNCTTFLVRYAVTDYQYYSAFCSATGAPSVFDSTEGSSITKQTVFLDLDVIDVSFKDEEIETVIPVVATSIDVFTDPKSPEIPGGVKSFFDLKWYQVVAIVVLLFIAVLIILQIVAFVFPPLQPLLNAIYRLLFLPVKLLVLITVFLIDKLVDFFEWLISKIKKE